MSSFKNHLFRYENLVVGGNLQSFIFAYKNNFPILIAYPEAPRFYEFFEPDIEFDISCIYNRLTELTDQYGSITTVGIKKRTLFDALLMKQAMMRGILFPAGVQTVRIEDEIKRIKVVSEKSRSYDISYNNLFVFTERNVVADNVQFPELKHTEVYKTFELKRVSTGTTTFQMKRFFEDEPCIWGYAAFSKYFNQKASKSKLVTKSIILPGQEKNDFYSDFTMIHFLKKQFSGTLSLKTSINQETGRKIDRHLLTLIPTVQVERRVYAQNEPLAFGNITVDLRQVEQMINE